MFNLERFVDAQEIDYETALGELRAGRKASHWIWFIFPQLTRLGYSEKSKFYGIEGIDEAKEYMNHPVLGTRYLKCVSALLGHAGRPITGIMGEVDSRKLQSSLTLMQAAGGGPSIGEALKAFYQGQPCARTMASVASDN